jgi:hypothetical protein
MRTFSIACLLVLVIAAFAIPTSHAAASAAVQNDTSYISSIGTYHIIGEVLNSGDTWLRFVKVTAIMKDTNGQVVDVDFTYAWVERLPPNERAPFNIFEIDTAKSARITSYTLALEFDAADPAEVLLQIQGPSTSTNILGHFEVVGEVKNNGPETSPFSKVIGTFYDAAGKVIYVDFTYTSPADIPPSQAYGFKITVTDEIASAKISRYALFADSSQYTSVPETPWPIVMLAAALTVAIVALRRKSSQLVS